MRNPSRFKWHHCEADIILCALRWYLRYILSDRDVEELRHERGVSVDHTTGFRWVQRDAPELEQRCRPWGYLYRAVDSTGATLEFMLSPTRDAEAAERFFRQVLRASHTRVPRVITVDKHAAYPLAFEALQYDRTR